NTKYSLHPIYLSEELRNITNGYENIGFLKNEKYILGLAGGYLKFGRFKHPIENPVIRINKVATAALDEPFQVSSLNSEGEFTYKTNNISFGFSVPQYKKFRSPRYSYRLLGLSPQWSTWSNIPLASFKNLSFGDYEFQVKGRVGNKASVPFSYNFSISRPWYFSTLAIIVYVLLFILLTIIVHQTYKRRHKKILEKNDRALRMKNLEAEQIITKLQNEQLEKEMDGKNKELAITTMSLIKKNEFLSNIKQKLENTSQSPEVKSVIRTIERDISEKDNWTFFKQAFNNADKDFFKKIKSRHPELTSNDLKLCAYLRLNLSSKEIAPLLNISVKSVEIKRYRLRKKMDLARETNLTDHIMEV
ncbi:MAG TPA: triple tyrosine motif-containing protein, partial [Salinimicrobium sp.]|nr:triple tyrosine motif-containing protein [Salinimicrobium sp.]